MALKVCPVCHKKFPFTNPQQVYCGEDCKHRQRRRVEAGLAVPRPVIRRPVEVPTSTRVPYTPCKTCVHWQRTSDPAYEMGGWCQLEALNTCKPWGVARLQREVSA